MLYLLALRLHTFDRLALERDLVKIKKGQEYLIKNGITVIGSGN